MQESPHVGTTFGLGAQTPCKMPRLSSPTSAGITTHRSDVLILSPGLLFLLNEIVEYDGSALLA